MSQENVDVIERGYEALRADDIETFLSFIHPDVEWHSLVLEIEGVFHGRDGVRNWWKGLRATFPDWEPTIIGIRDFGDRVVTHARASGSGAVSGVGIDQDFWQVVEFREGLVARYWALRTEQEALEAAGLSE